jgi:hypothetical protein
MMPSQILRYMRGDFTAVRIEVENGSGKSDFLKN